MRTFWKISYTIFTFYIASCSSSDKKEEWHNKSEYVIDAFVFGHQLNPNCNKKDTIEARVGCVVKKIHKGSKIKVDDTLILLHYFKDAYTIPDNQNYQFYLRRPERGYEFIYEILHFEHLRKQ